MLIKSVASDLISRGHVSAAATLTFGYLRSSKEVAAGLEMRVGALVGLLSGGVDSVISERRGSEGIEDKILRRFMGETQRLSEASREAINRISNIG